MSAERDRLNEVPHGRAPWRHWGPYLSERAWGTVREDYSADGDAWSFFPHDHARSRAYRWNEDGLGGHLRRPADALLRARVLERPRPDPEGAHLRAHRPRGQPRRGRQGVLVVPRLDADALVDALALHVPAGRVPLRAAASPRTRARGQLDPEFELVDTGIFDDGRYWEITADYAKASPEDILVRVSVRNAGPGARRRSTCCRRSGSATRGRGATTSPKPLDPARGRRARRRARRARHARALGRAARPRRSSARTRRTPSASSARRTRRRTRRTASATTSSTARRPSTRSRPGRRRRSATGSRSPAGETRDDRAAARASSRGLGDDFDDGDDARASARPTSSTPSSPRPAPPPTRRSSSARRSPGCSGRKQFFHYDVRALARRRPGRPAAAGVALARPQPRVDAPRTTWT